MLYRVGWVIVLSQEGHGWVIVLLRGGWVGHYVIERSMLLALTTALVKRGAYYLLLPRSSEEISILLTPI